MTISDILMILAVLLAPFLAVYVQKKIETWKSQRDTKLWIFKTLMATRGATLSPQHVQALNMIDLEFSGKDKKKKRLNLSGKSTWIIWPRYRKIQKQVRRLSLHGQKKIVITSLN